MADRRLEFRPQQFPPGEKSFGDDAEGLLVEELRLIDVAGEQAGRNLAAQRFDVLPEQPDQHQKLGQGIAGEALRALDVALEMGAVAAGKALDQSLAELGFGTEMVEECALGHAGRADHVIDRGCRKAPEEHQPLGGVHDGALGLRSVLSQPSLLVLLPLKQTAWSVDERVFHNTKSRRARKWPAE